MSEQSFRCTIHNVDFSCKEVTVEKNGRGKHAEEMQLIKCPLCTNKLIKHLRAENELLLQHRDALLEAIEIKQTVGKTP